MTNAKPLEFYKNYKGCWNCSSHIPNKYGYVYITRNKVKQKMHRYIYEKYYGSIPRGKCVCHTCDNKKCGNPEHLFLGTYRDNSHDAVNKNRLFMKKGEQHPYSYLTEKDIKAIRIEESSFAKKAKKYNTSPSNIAHIIHRRRWKHI